MVLAPYSILRKLGRDTAAAGLCTPLSRTRCPVRRETTSRLLPALCLSLLRTFVPLRFILHLKNGRQQNARLGDVWLGFLEVRMPLARYSYGARESLLALVRPRSAGPARQRLILTAPGIRYSCSPRSATFHSLAPGRKRSTGHDHGEVPNQPPPTDFDQMDLLGATPAPSTSVDVCTSDGFHLNSGAKVLGGSGVLLVGGAAFVWKPWGVTKKLVNGKGQWEVDSPKAFGLLGLVWPRPGALPSWTRSSRTTRASGQDCRRVDIVYTDRCDRLADLGFGTGHAPLEPHHQAAPYELRNASRGLGY